MNKILCLALALSGVLSAAAEDECASVAEDALRYATNTTCDLSVPQCRKYYYDKFLRECQEAAYGRKPDASSKPDKASQARAQAYFKNAAASLNAGRPDEAIGYFTKALKETPDNAELYYNRGMVYSRTRRGEKAIADLSRAIKLKKNVAGGNAYVLRGIELFNKKDFDGAISDFSSAIELTPRDANAYASRASVYAAKGEHSMAVADYGAAIKLSPSNPKFYAARSQSYRKLGKTAAAEADEGAFMRLSGE